MEAETLEKERRIIEQIGNEELLTPAQRKLLAEFDDDAGLKDPLEAWESFLDFLTDCEEEIVFDGILLGYVEFGANIL